MRINEILVPRRSPSFYPYDYITKSNVSLKKQVLVMFKNSFVVILEKLRFLFTVVTITIIKRDSYFYDFQIFI